MQKKKKEVNDKEIESVAWQMFSFFFFFFVGEESSNLIVEIPVYYRNEPHDYIFILLRLLLYLKCLWFQKFNINKVLGKFSTEPLAHNNI